MRLGLVVRRLASAVFVAAGSTYLVLPVVSAEPSAAKRLSAIEVLVDERGLVVSLAGDGRLTPSAIHEAEYWPPRLVVDLPEVASSVPAVTAIAAGPVEDIRVVVHSLEPLVTRVVFELRRSTAYEIDESAVAGRLLTFIFPLGAAPSDLSQDDVGQDQGQDQNQDARVAWPSNPGPRLLLARAVVEPVSGRSGALPSRAGLLREFRSQPTAIPGATALTLSPTFPLGATAASELSPTHLSTRPMNDGLPLTPFADAVVGVPVDAEVTPRGRLDVRAPEWSATTSGVVHTATGRSTLIRPSRVPAAPTTQLQQVTQGTPREYSGDAVSMDFQGADLRAVLRTFSEISGLNVVIDPQVDGTVDVALTEVPWDQALDVILRANQLGYVLDGTVVRIAPLRVLADEETQRRQLAEEQALAGELVVLTRTLSYARADAMAELITRSVLSARGQVQTDERTNTLIISDLQPRLGAAEDLLDTLDRAEPQVEIEARIVQAGRDFARSLGVQWGLTGRVSPELGNTTPLTFPNRGGISGRVGTQGAGVSGADARARETENVGTAVNLPASGASSAIGVTLGAVDGSLNLDVVLSAAEGDGQIRLLSHPRVTTQNNVAAEIVQGDQIPIQTVANNTVTVQFEDAALSLRVTPQITADDTVIMQIEIDNDFADFGREINGVPPIVTQRASTTVQVANGDTTVIGGIFESERSSSNDRVPGLHRIPLLGWLFRSESERESTDELLIFLTPKIVR